MKECKKTPETAMIARTYETELAVVHVCTDDIIVGAEAAEQKREAVSQLINDILYRQAVRKVKEEKL